MSRQIASLILAALPHKLLAMFAKLRQQGADLSAKLILDNKN